LEGQDNKPNEAMLNRLVGNVLAEVVDEEETEEEEEKKQQLGAAANTNTN
jgi:hypothetical protein